MITIRKNPNFQEWFQVFAFGKFIDELRSKAQAMDLANSIAKNNRKDFYHVEDQRVKVKPL